jgi:hypothetical protein
MNAILDNTATALIGTQQAAAPNSPEPTQASGPRKDTKERWAAAKKRSAKKNNDDDKDDDEDHHMPLQPRSLSL